MTMQGHDGMSPDDELAEVQSSKGSVLGDLAEQASPKSLLTEAAGYGAGKLGGLVEESLEGKKGELARIAVEKATKAVAGLVLDVLIPGKRIDPVSYEIAINGGPDLDWHVRRLELEEVISAPYRMTVEMLTEDTDGVFNVDELLGADLVLEYGRNGVFRRVCGVIDRVDTIGIASERLKVRVHVVPALRSLAQRNDTRVFQDLTVPQILEEVLAPALAEYDRKLDVSKLNDTYLPRDYCVQFKESDLEFCHRLMEEEGISYYFEVLEDEQVETMVLADQAPAKPNEDFPEVESVIDGSVPIITDRPDTADTESIQHFEWSRPESITKVTTRQFNWKRPDPNAPPEAEQEQADERGRTRESYIPDDRRRIEDKQGDDGYQGTEVDEDETPHTGKTFEMLTAARAQGTGDSNVTGFRAGGLFVIGDHPHPDVAEARLLLTRVVHRGDCPEEEQGDEARGNRYQNEFECIPATAVFRPSAVTTKPKVYGAQTATVTGPAGEEIHTDAHGRIKVRFHWDRLSPLDQTSSCWVRVAQMWGGTGWGTWFLPRIGMEVVVQFLDGNPDRPLVVGCVYNGQNKPPYPLPEKKTTSTIKSNSSLGGGGFNEFRFEDLKGSEQIYLHAQKNLDEVVNDNHSRSVGSNETVSVGANRTVSVGGGSNLSVGNIKPPADGKPPPGPVAGEYKIEVQTKIELKCGASSLVMDDTGKIKLEGTDITIHSKGPIAENADGEMVLTGSVIKLN
ncbi:type VI secretion system Vgr family protein [Paraliomyxa miuraensis]|uniref:type VI secretion system Vgr family protein n=1 Tax=Paraliomyxa miuraensis TaxID=376150 RepID=UPI00224E0A14|nr:type VI secretion system tip protein TssI/VgrG [Paraliomyxa miuraensis]MCX4247870.1 type VI secretion system tip protein VgrG [Paraliomyxa miuraensis]